MAGLGRNFGFLWSSAVLSNLGDGVLKVGAPLLAVSMTRSPTEVSLVGAAATLPWLLVALPAGAIADRLDRRRIMAIANAARAGVLVVAAALAALGLLNLWIMLPIVLAAGVSEVFADTAAQAVLPMTVPPLRLTAANGRVVGAQTVGNDFAGAPLAGMLVTLLPAAVFGAPAALYGAAGLLLLGMRGRFRPTPRATPQATPRAAHRAAPAAGPAAEASMARDIAEALRYLWAHRFLRTLALSAGMTNLAMAAYWGVFVLWVVGAESRIGLEPGGYGLMLTALAAGALAGSFLSERITRPGREAATLVVMWAVSGLLHLVPVLLPTAWLLYPTAVAWGLAGAVGNVLVVSIRQRLIPSALLGRVNSAYRLIGMGGMPLGAALGGVMGELAGLPAVFLSAVGLCAMAVCLVWRVALKPISHHVTSDHTVDSTSGSLSAH